MTRPEFIAALRATPYVNGIVGGPVLQSVNAAGDKFYLINVRKIKDDKLINYENISYVVIDEGTVNEKVFFYKTDTVDFDNLQEVGKITTTTP